LVSRHRDFNIPEDAQGYPVLDNLATIRTWENLRGRVLSDYADTRAKFTEWGIFERVFTSAAAGMRKPDLCFFKFVLGEIKAEPSSVVFVDNQLENVLAARSLGMNGIVFDDVHRVRQSLRFFTGDPVSRGLSFLESRAGRLESETNHGQTVAENFAQLLIWEATNKR
jgi:hypothetical protein